MLYYCGECGDWVYIEVDENATICPICGCVIC